jgi:hypothetical protein
MLMHAAVSNTLDVVPSAVAGAADPFAWSRSPVAWLTVALLWIGATYFLLRLRGVSEIPGFPAEAASTAPGF